MASLALIRLPFFLFLPPPAIIYYFYGARGGELARFKGKQKWQGVGQDLLVPAGRTRQLKAACCLPPAGSLLHFDLKRHSWCLCHPLGAIWDWEFLGTQGVPADQSWDPAVAKVLDPPFQTEGLGKRSGARSSSAQENVHSASCRLLWRGGCSLGEGELYFGYPRARGFLAKICNLPLTGQNKTCLSPFTVLDPSSEDILTKSYFKNHSRNGTDFLSTT